MDVLVKDDALVVLKIVVESLVELTVPVPARSKTLGTLERSLFTRQSDSKRLSESV